MRRWSREAGAPPSAFGQAIRALGTHLLPGLFVFPILGAILWLLGYAMTGSMVAFAGSLSWLGFPPDRRSAKSAVESALFLGIASFLLEVTLWRGK